MSVFNPRSFLMPLMDKKNLITIILVAVFFGFYRVAGGRVYTQPKASPGKKVSATEIVSPFGDDIPDINSLSPAADIKKLSGGAQTAPKDKHATLNELLGSESSTSTKGPETKPNNLKQGGDSKLDDIERRLGLRQ